VKISSISDIHIKSPTDKSYALLLDFLNHKEVSDSDGVLLLGDIFDFMMGEHKEYLDLYKDFFKALNSLLQNGKEVHFFEGNHDFHLEGLFKHHLKSEKFFYHTKGIQKTIGEKKVYFCHGDDIQIGDPTYKILKFVLRNRFSRFLFNKVFPFKVQQFVAEFFSNKSRKRGQAYYSNQDVIKEIFRKSAINFWKFNTADILVCGHSHCQDDFRPMENRKYLNNGYFPNSGNFLVIDEAETRFCKINLSV
jgi:UDP-2,3-diacylglucosamine hydrolase